ANRLTDLLGKVKQLSEGPLNRIAQTLADAFRVGRDALEAQQSPSAVRQRLQEAGALQNEVIQSLEQMLGLFTEWDSFSRLAPEVGQIRADEQHLASET